MSFFKTCKKTQHTQVSTTRWGVQCGRRDLDGFSFLHKSPTLSSSGLFGGQPGERRDNPRKHCAGCNADAQAPKFVPSNSSSSQRTRRQNLQYVSTQAQLLQDSFLISTPWSGIFFCERKLFLLIGRRKICQRKEVITYVEN